MPLTPNPIVMEVIAEFDTRADAFEINDVGRAILAASKDQGKLADDARLAWWAEWAACEFSVRERDDGGPWKTYFQPVMTLQRNDGSMEHRLTATGVCDVLPGGFVARAAPMPG